ncbi:MAG: SURF1 family protein [Rickettsiales bacterium]
MRLKKPRPIPLIMTAVAVVTMFSLGIWQVERLAWKEKLIATIEDARRQPPVPVLPATENDIRKLAFQRVQLEGEFLHEHEFHLAARYDGGVLGYHILTPFKLLDGRIVLLNRGWVPAAKKNPETREQGNITGKISVIGMVRTDRDRNWFTPANQPEKNLWFAKDVGEMASFSHLPLEPVALDVLYDKPPGGIPKPFNGDLEPRNDHLGYAFTWFAIGFACLIIFIIYHRDDKKQNQIIDAK